MAWRVKPRRMFRDRFVNRDRDRRGEPTINGDSRDGTLAAMDQRLFTLESGLVGLREGMNSLQTHIDVQIEGIRTGNAAQLESLRTALVERSRPQWQLMVTIIGVAMAAIGGLWAVGVAPINGTLIQHTSDLRRIQDAIVPRAEHQERWRITERDMSQMAALFEKQDDRLKRDIENVNKLSEQRKMDSEAKFIPRIELDGRIKSLEIVNSDAQRQIDALRSQTTGTYGPRDIIQRLQVRLDAMENRIFDGKSPKAQE